MGFGWPGNLRQLENVVERAVLFTEVPRIRREDLPRELGVGSVAPSLEGGPLPLRERVRDATRSIEREAILEALEQTRGNVTRAARELGLSRRGLQLKMRDLGIERENPG